MILAAIPCYNESRTVGSVVLMTKPYVSKVVVIDDGSRDDSAVVAQAAGADVRRYYYNVGYGAATAHAFYVARTLEADILVTLDADGQHDPREIPKLIEPILSGGYDVAIGSRFMSAANKAPPYRQFGQRVLALMGSIGFGVWLTDNQCGFRAFNKRAIHAIQLREPGMGVSEEIHEMIAHRRLVYTEVPVNVTY